MNTVRVELRHLAYEANARTHKYEDFKKTYIFVSEQLSEEETKLSVKAPPPELLAQLVRNMIYPNVLPESIPELLEVLHNIEQWRRKVWARADLVLVSTQYWKDQSSGLTDRDRIAFQAIVDSHEIVRYNFVEILRRYCHWHLHHIWEHGSVNDFLNTFSYYFPMLANNAEGYPLLKHLDAYETGKFAELGKVWLNFVSEWLGKVAGTKADPQIEIYAEDRLQREAAAYLVLVQQQIDTLERALDKEKYEHRIAKRKA
ncbi:hypothetical protein D9757_006463 [Collybiopsis confluens]|uniref:Uncharacterized protein n=1 Tax=Collybiopsis confluens TaxID=2823264 RepID=A0A8H5M894_9AGAR|nr:hypothetical protein D9757_006463 [Collybiopsis confluens]